MPLNISSTPIPPLSSIDGPRTRYPILLGIIPLFLPTDATLPLPPPVARGVWVLAPLPVPTLVLTPARLFILFSALSTLLSFFIVLSMFTFKVTGFLNPVAILLNVLEKVFSCSPTVVSFFTEVTKLSIPAEA